MAIITLTTDFGEGSRYVAAMKGVILSINPDARIVDATHSVPPQDIAAGARTLAEISRWFPADTIHIAVVDPGVGSEREIVYAEFDAGRFICPNNGLLTNLAASGDPRRLVAVTNAEHWMPQVSPTFHGRDIMAPVAARLSLGLSPDRLGPPRSEPLLIGLRRATRTTDADFPNTGGPHTGGPEAENPEERGVGERIQGEVVEVDSFGNLITNITEAMLEDCPGDESVTVRCDEHETIGLQKTYADQPPMTLVALVGSSGVLELAIVDDSAKVMLGVGVGAPVVVAW